MTIRLEVPATPTSLRVVRVASAAAAAEATDDVDRLDDVRLAVDEMAVAAMDGAAPAARLCLELHRRDGTLVVSGAVDGTCAFDAEFDLAPGPARIRDGGDRRGGAGGRRSPVGPGPTPCPP